MIRACTSGDVAAIFEIINDGAQAYRGIIPADCWHDPYMPMDELKEQIAQGIGFWGYEAHGKLAGVMGSQDRGEVTLIRHAYVRTAQRRKGIGERLLKHLEGMSAKPVLIGTWAAAGWAIDFYRKHGYRLLSTAEKNRVLPKYWKIPQRQIETSVVLANPAWKS